MQLKRTVLAAVFCTAFVVMLPFDMAAAPRLSLQEPNARLCKDFEAGMGHLAVLVSDHDKLQVYIRSVECTTEDMMRRGTPTQKVSLSQMQIS